MLFNSAVMNVIPKQTNFCSLEPLISFRRIKIPTHRAVKKIVSGSKMNEKLKLQLEKSMSGDMQKAFDILDRRGNGTIGLRDVKVTLRALGIEPTASKVVRLTELSSGDKTRELSREEFEKMFECVLNDVDSDEQLARAYRMFDIEGKGGVTFRGLKKVAEDLHMDVADEEIQEMISSADNDGDGIVTLEEFIGMARKIF